MKTQKRKHLTSTDYGWRRDALWCRLGSWSIYWCNMDTDETTGQRNRNGRGWEAESIGCICRIIMSSFDWVWIVIYMGAVTRKLDFSQLWRAECQGGIHTMIWNFCHIPYVCFYYFGYCTVSSFCRHTGWNEVSVISKLLQVIYNKLFRKINVSKMIQLLTAPKFMA